MSTTAFATLYDIPEELTDFRNTIRQIVDERIRPRAAEIDESGEYPWDVRKLLAEHDVLALPFAEEHGKSPTISRSLAVKLWGDPF